MIRLRVSALAVGGIVLAAGLLILAAPRTVHAVAAALVQVTNTASNPVVNADATRICGANRGDLLCRWLGVQ
jgi:hypothetical protein